VSLIYKKETDIYGVVARATVIGVEVRSGPDHKQIVVAKGFGAKLWQDH
jgi:hypothetical protein